MSGAEGGFTCQLELESVGLVFHYPTCGSRAGAASLAASHTRVSMGTLSGSRPGELGPQETSSQSLSKKKMEQVYWMAFQDLRETRDPGSMAATLLVLQCWHLPPFFLWEVHPLSWLQIPPLH